MTQVLTGLQTYMSALRTDMSALKVFLGNDDSGKADAVNKTQRRIIDLEELLSSRFCVPKSLLEKLNCIPQCFQN